MHTNYFTYAIPQNAGPSQIMQIPAPAITSRAINQPSQHNYPTATANVVTVNTTKYVQQAQILTQPSSSSSSKPSNTSSAHGSNESQTVCTICHQSFKKSSSLLKHMRVHRTKNETEPAKPAASSFVCNVCKIDYVNAATFEYHIRTQHNTPQLMSCIECGCVGVMSAGTTASYRCDDCSSKSMKVEYASSNSPEYHVKPRTRSKSSKHAIKSIGDADMNQLVEIMRSGDANGRRRKSHECTWCGRTYKHQSTLAMHLKTHTGEYKYKCEYCDKEFMLAEYYNRHLRVHTKEKPYQCDVCDKSFSQSNTLIQHKRIHTGMILRFLTFHAFFAMNATNKPFIFGMFQVKSRMSVQYAEKPLVYEITC